MNDLNVFPAGVVTLVQWMMMGDGMAYLHLWASEWKVVTNQASGIEGLRTTERWHLCAYASDGNLLVVVPGCQVKCFSACEKNPSIKGGPTIYTVGGS